MADDLDDLLRRAMKTLDSQVPSGYFDALPKQALARLEGSMQPSTGSTERDTSSGVPPVNEDSGLHDIRNLAQSTKQRLSNKRISTSPVASEEEILAASSAGWKAAVALPEPAKMVSLPSIDELPSKKEVRAMEKAAAVAAAAPAAAPAVEMRQQFKLPSAQRKSRAPLAIVGVLAAAAAGVGIYFVMQNQSDSANKVASSGANTGTVVAAAQPAPAPVAAPAPAPKQEVQVQPIEEPPPAAEATKDEAAAGDQVAATTPPVGKAAAPAKHVMTKGKSKPDLKATETVKTEVETKTPPPPADKADKKVEGKKVGKGSDENEPNFDDLLKEAGVDKTKKVQAPKLANKELSGDDFKKGMSAVSAAAQKCYQGTQGTVSFKLTVAPSGKVAKVAVNGAFAGKPEGECVRRAVQNATFPPWDGGPQSFTYSYLLAE